MEITTSGNDSSKQAGGELVDNNNHHHHHLQPLDPCTSNSSNSSNSSSSNDDDEEEDDNDELEEEAEELVSAFSPGGNHNTLLFRDNWSLQQTQSSSCSDFNPLQANVVNVNPCISSCAAVVVDQATETAQFSTSTSTSTCNLDLDAGFLAEFSKMSTLVDMECTWASGSKTTTTPHSPASPSPPDQQSSSSSSSPPHRSVYQTSSQRSQPFKDYIPHLSPSLSLPTISMQQLDLLLENLAANRQLQEYDNFEEEVVEEYTPSYETNMRPDGCAEDHKGIQLQHYNIIYPSTTAINNTTSLPATTNTKQPSDGGTDKDEFFSAIESQDCEEGEFEEENDGDEDEEDEDGNDDVFMTTTTASSTAATSSSAKKKKKKKKKSKKTKKNKMDSQTSAMALSSTLLTSASSSSSNYSLSAIPSTSTNTKSLVASMLVMDALSLVEDDDENSSSQGTEPDQSSFMSSSKRLSFNNIGGLSDDRKDSKLDLEIDVPRDSDSSGKQRPLQQQQQYKNLLQQQQQLYIDPFPSGKFELSVSSRLPVILYPLVIDEIMRMSNDVMIVSMYRTPDFAPSSQQIHMYTNKNNHQQQYHFSKFKQHTDKNSTNTTPNQLLFDPPHKYLSSGGSLIIQLSRVEAPLFSSTAPQSPVIFDPQQHLVIRLRDLVKRAILQKCPGGSGSGNGGRTSSSKGNNNIKSVGGATTAELMAILGDDLVDMFTLKAVDDLVNENGNFVDSIGGYRRVGSSGNRSRNHNSIGSTYGALPDRSSIISRLMKDNIFFTDAISPQVVVVACRAGFAIPLLKKFLEPIQSSTSSGHLDDMVGIRENYFNKDEMDWIPTFEVLGLKYVESIDEFHAKMLTPFDLGDFKWRRSLEILMEELDQDSGSRGWMFMALRKSDALKDVNDVVSSLLDSYRQIFSPKDTFVKKTSTAAAASVVTDKTNCDDLKEGEVLGLNVIVSSSPDATYAHLVSFFNDEELFSGYKPMWQERPYLPQYFLTNPCICHSMTTTAPILSTVCIIRPELFPHLSDILSKLSEKGLVLGGLKMKKIGYANALHIIECMDSEFSNSSSPLSSKPPPPPPLHMRANTKQHARDEDFSSNTVDRTFLELLKMEAVIALCLVGENAIKKFRSFLLENTNFSNNQFQFLNYRVGRGNSAITVNSAIYGSFTQPMCEYFQSHIFTEGPVVQLLAVDQIQQRLSPLLWSNLPIYTMLCIENPSYRRPIVPAIPHNHSSCTYSEPELAFVFMLSSSIDSSEGTTSSWIKYLDSLLGGGGGASSTSIKPVSSSTKFLPKHHRKHIKPSAAAVVDSSMMEHGSLKIMAARLLMCAKDLSVAFAETLDSPADVLNLESKVQNGPCLVMAIEGVDAMSKLRLALNRLSPQHQSDIIVSHSLDVAKRQICLMFPTLDYDSAFALIKKN